MRFRPLLSEVPPWLALMLEGERFAVLGLTAR
jgi:hypothetical protein